MTWPQGLFEALRPRAWRALTRPKREAAYATTARSWAAACATYRGHGELPPRQGGGRGRRAARRPRPERTEGDVTRSAQRSEHTAC